MAAAPGVILVRDGRPEERHDPVAGRCELLPAGVAESLAHRVEGGAARAGDAAPEGGTALAAEASGLAVLVPAARTPHPKVPPASFNPLGARHSTAPPAATVRASRSRRASPSD